MDYYLLLITNSNENNEELEQLEERFNQLQDPFYILNWHRAEKEKILNIENIHVLKNIKVLSGEMYDKFLDKLISEEIINDEIINENESNEEDIIDLLIKDIDKIKEKITSKEYNEILDKIELVDYENIVPLIQDIDKIKEKITTEEYNEIFNKIENILNRHSEEEEDGVEEDGIDNLEHEKIEKEQNIEPELQKVLSELQKFNLTGKIIKTSDGYYKRRDIRKIYKKFGKNFIMLQINDEIVKSFKGIYNVNIFNDIKRYKIIKNELEQIENGIGPKIEEVRKGVRGIEVEEVEETKEKSYLSFTPNFNTQKEEIPIEPNGVGVGVAIDVNYAPYPCFGNSKLCEDNKCETCKGNKLVYDELLYLYVYEDDCSIISLIVSELEYIEVPPVFNICKKAEFKITKKCKEKIYELLNNVYHENIESVDNMIQFVEKLIIITNTSKNAYIINYVTENYKKSNNENGTVVKDLLDKFRHEINNNISDNEFLRLLGTVGIFSTDYLERTQIVVKKESKITNFTTLLENYKLAQTVKA
jgi:hypothetical protein